MIWRVVVCAVVAAVLVVPLAIQALVRHVCDLYVRAWFEGDKRAFIQWYQRNPRWAQQRITRWLPPE